MTYCTQKSIVEEYLHVEFGVHLDLITSGLSITTSRSPLLCLHGHLFGFFELSPQLWSILLLVFIEIVVFLLRCILLLLTLISKFQEISGTSGAIQTVTKGLLLCLSLVEWSKRLLIIGCLRRINIVCIGVSYWWTLNGRSEGSITYWDVRHHKGVPER